MVLVMGLERTCLLQSLRQVADRVCNAQYCRFKTDRRDYLSIQPQIILLGHEVPDEALPSPVFKCSAGKVVEDFVRLTEISDPPLILVESAPAGGRIE